MQEEALGFIALRRGPHSQDREASPGLLRTMGPAGRVTHNFGGGAWSYRRQLSSARAWEQDINRTREEQDPVVNVRVL